MDIDGNNNLQPGSNNGQSPGILPRNLELLDSVDGTFTCTWNLKNFSKVDPTPGKSCRSKVFKSVEGRPCLDLTILFYPGGQDEEHQESRCYLQFRKNHYGMFVKTVISFQATNGQLIAQRSHRWVVLGHKRICKGPEGVSRQELLQSLAGDDVLLLKAEVRYSSSNFKNADTERNFMMTTQSGLFAEAFTNMLMRMSPDFLIVSHGQYHPVHKVVLIANSKVFADLLLQNDGLGRLDVDDFETDAVDAMVFFLYNGRLSDLSMKLLLNVIRIAHAYGLDALKLYCYRFMVAVTPNHRESFNLRDTVYWFNYDRGMELCPEAINQIVNCLQGIPL